ncbi:Uncharacterised protein [Citrobacter amalonaticus]|jgi:hypothetical protein|nr:Uncharacterised protein [Citrobacter amalonaticus]
MIPSLPRFVTLSLLCIYLFSLNINSESRHPHGGNILLYRVNHWLGMSNGLLCLRNIRSICGKGR